jgi:two-component sensor histidine kinase
MIEFFRHLFSADFAARVLCLRDPDVIALHVISDGLIALSYLAILAALVPLVRRRTDLPFRWAYLLFGIFILACGAMHLLSILTLWHPVYRLEGLIKAVTALASAGTAVVLFRLVPVAVALPGPAQFKLEIEERKRAEDEVRRLDKELENSLLQRTAQLNPAAAHLAEVGATQSVACISDITIRKLADQERENLIVRLESALAERDVLFKEIHHRVKNNLAVIVGLLGMQSNTVGDERLTAALTECQQRVASMALIHEFLYANEDMSRVDFGDYVQQLTTEVSTSYNIGPDSAVIEMETERIHLPVHRAIPCGLILNELLSNALKHAFSAARAGKVTVRFVRLESGELSLSCLDNGVGIPPDFDWKNSPSMGLKIIQILAKQLHGSLSLDRSEGTRFELRFLDHGSDHISIDEKAKAARTQ